MSEQKPFDLNETLARDLLQEKRKDRLWRNIRFIFWFGLIAIIVYGIFSHMHHKNTLYGKKYTALVRLDGMIAPNRDFSSENVVPRLRKAFADPNAVGVVIDINSPGGTPVQASIIHDAIIAYKKHYHKKVVVVGEDLLTSGAYLVATAADEIYVNADTLTGSIGVIMQSFGFVDLMKKIGVERRVYTAGTEKDRLDPFLPQTPEDITKIQQVMGEVHENFIEDVLKGRQGKLHGDPSKLFNGDFWSGQTAVKLGLADHLGNLMDAMYFEFGTTNYKEFGEPSFFHMLSGQLNSSFDALMYEYK